jgi:hypothetical protein
VQLFCSFLFLFAASLFGTIISQVNEIVAQHASMTKELDTILEMYLAVQPRNALLTATPILSTGGKRFDISERNLTNQSMNKPDWVISCRLDIKTLFTVRYWERYKFLIDYEHKQASHHSRAQTS